MKRMIRIQSFPLVAIEKNIEAYTDVARNRGIIGGAFEVFGYNEELAALVWERDDRLARGFSDLPQAAWTDFGRGAWVNAFWSSESR